MTDLTGTTAPRWRVPSPNEPTERGGRAAAARQAADVADQITAEADPTDWRYPVLVDVLVAAETAALDAAIAEAEGLDERADRAARAARTHARAAVRWLAL